jgi:hypothetical protein
MFTMHDGVKPEELNSANSNLLTVFPFHPPGYHCGHLWLDPSPGFLATDANQEQLVVVCEFVPKVVLHRNVDRRLDRHPSPVFRIGADRSRVIANGCFRATGVLAAKKVFDFVLVKPLPMPPFPALAPSFPFACHDKTASRFWTA